MVTSPGDTDAGDPPSEDACSSHGLDSGAPDSVTLDSVTLEPRASTWPSLIRRAALTPFQQRTREQLDLPTDRPVIMSGHQSEVWHPGILAKWFAGLALARLVGGIFVWLHVDQDTNEPGAIEVPALDASGALVKRALTLIEPTKDIPTGARPAKRIDAAALRLVRGETLMCQDAVTRIVDALNRHASEATLALQFGRAIETMLGEMQIAGDGVRSITTSRLAATDAFATMVELLRHDPVGAIEAHNHAVARAPDAGIRALGLKHSSSHEHPARVEMPLWRVTPGGPRMPVSHSQLASIPLGELRPRALLMTGLARLGACDLFIHGTGGGIYDRVTDAWFESWFDGTNVPHTKDVRESLPLAPTTVATATARLPFDARHGGVSQTHARKASHAAHHARHNPGLLDDEHASHAKRELVDRIARSTDRAERAVLFRDMHTLLDRVRSEGGSRLADLERAALDARRRAAEQSVVAERTWPFPLYPDATLNALRRRIEQEIGA